MQTVVFFLIFVLEKKNESKQARKVLAHISMRVYVCINNCCIVIKMYIN